MACIAQNLPPVLYSSGRKTAHRGVAARRCGASGKTRLQAARPSGKNPRRATTARQTHLLPQTTQQQPCGGVAGAVLDSTGGQSNQSALDDIVDNFVDTNDSLASTLTKAGLSLAGGGTAAAGYYGTTPGKAIGIAWSTYNSAVRIPGLIGSATPLQLVSTAVATWAINSVLIKGSYDAGVLIGSALRTAANRVAAAVCGKPQ